MAEIRILTGDALERLAELEDGSVQCVVTSPPYWGLRDYGIDGQLGLEKTPEEYVGKLVEVFREVRRVLRDDGTLWLNLGDSYANDTKWGGSSGGKHVEALYGKTGVGRQKVTTGLKPKDLVGIPWRVAFALQADWYLRSDIIWSKPNPMPESVTDRPTKAHEYLFLLTKSARYYYDEAAIREDAVKIGSPNHLQGGSGERAGTRDGLRGAQWDQEAGRNKRSVWTIATQPFPEAHFATFPPKLVEPCVLAGTSARGACSQCGAPFERVVDRPSAPPEVFTNREAPEDDLIYSGSRSGGKWKGQGQKLQSWRDANPAKTIDWRATCDHDGPTRPCLVLDPFAGAGTVALVCARLFRDSIGIELSADYASMAADRIRQDAPLLNNAALIERSSSR